MSEASLNRAARTNVPVAVASMAFSAVIVTLMHVTVRAAGKELSPYEVTFFRALFTLIVMMPLVLRRPRERAWRTRKPGQQILRGVIGVLAIFTWYYALATIPLAEAVALNFTSSIFITVGAALFLGETVGVRRWSAVAIGLVGALIIVRPGLVEVSLGALAALVGSVLWAVMVLMTKSLARHDGNVTLVFYSAVLVVPLSFPAALATWETPDLRLLAILAAGGLLAAIGHTAMAHALRMADASVTVPVDLTRLVWAAVFGFLLFGEIPDLWTVAGAGLIVLASLYIAIRESQVARRSVSRRQEGGTPP